MASGPTHQKMAADIWSVVDLLRGDYRRTEYGHVILPFTVLRRLDAVLSITGLRTARVVSGVDEFVRRYVNLRKLGTELRSSVLPISCLCQD